MKLNGNTILITDGDGGLGFGFAYRLCELGNKVIITGRHAQRLEEVKQILPAVHTVHCDISLSENVAELSKELTRKFPGLNMLINISGEMAKLIFHENRIFYDITREIEINLMGPASMVRHFLPHFKTKRSAAILNVTSGIAFMPFPVLANGKRVKSALRTYTQCLRDELKNTGIKVFELAAPGSFTPIDIEPTQMDGFFLDDPLTPSCIIENAIERIRNDIYEIDPTLSNLLRARSRLAPNSCFNN